MGFRDGVVGRGRERDVGAGGGEEVGIVDLGARPQEHRRMRGRRQDYLLVLPL
jgi:hypothetical protein